MYFIPVKILNVYAKNSVPEYLHHHDTLEKIVVPGIVESNPCVECILHHVHAVPSFSSLGDLSISKLLKGKNLVPFAPLNARTQGRSG